MMLDTAFAQLRFAASLLLGVRFSSWSLDRLAQSMLDTRREFGSVGPDGAEMLGGPALDEESRHEVQVRRFRAQAQHATRETTYYKGLFERFGIDPSRLRYEDIQTLPLTPKEALWTDPDAFVRRSAKPYMRMLTTGTTGRPTAVYFSTYELRTIVALSAIGFLFNGQIGPEDIVQISASARAVLGNLGLAGACARIGATVYVAGLIDPAETLALLAEKRRIAGKKPRASVMSTYPSYLGSLIECGLRLGYRPSDFGLERIFVGGEIVTEGLRVRCRQVFGNAQLVESYAMTETIPFGGTVCSAGHLHFEVSHGLLEVQNPDTGAPAQPGEAGTIVATPFFPYRETTLLLRYDTQDVVRAVDRRPKGVDGCALECSHRNLPATSNLLGKLRLSARHDDGWTYPRDVLEALEGIEAVPLPARCGFWPVTGGVAVEVVARQNTARTRVSIGEQLEQRGVPVRELHMVADRGDLHHPLPLRGDLREIPFDRTWRAAVESSAMMAHRISPDYVMAGGANG